MFGMMDVCGGDETVDGVMTRLNQTTAQVFGVATETATEVKIGGMDEAEGGQGRLLNDCDAGRIRGANLPWLRNRAGTCQNLSPSALIQGLRGLRYQDKIFVTFFLTEA
jgi:hypothetical protein